MLDTWWVASGYFGLALVSAVVPWVNAELLMLSAVPVVGSPAHLAVLVATVTAGQMTGKASVYWIARSTTRPPGPRLEQALDRWRVRLERRPGSALAVTFVSSTTGCPPFYLVSVMAGALKMAFGRFLAIGLLGRLIHFGIVAFLPQMAWRGL